MDDIFDKAVGFGKYQYLKIFWIALPCLSLGPMWTMQIYWGQTPEHLCSNDTNVPVYISCDLSNTTSCDYVMNSSYVSDFDLVCQNSFVVPYIQSAMLAGTLIGTLIFGTVSDMIGRRRTILSSIIVLSFACVGIVISPYTGMWQILLFSCFLCGIGAGGQAQYTLPMEISSTENRRKVVPFIESGWMISWFGYLATSYFTRDWKIASLMCFTPVWICCICYYWIIPESPRWLYQKGKRLEALNLLKEIAKQNGNEIDQKMEDFILKGSIVEKRKGNKFNKTLFLRWLALSLSQ